jgi:general secretion pathway protein J
MTQRQQGPGLDPAAGMTLVELLVVLVIVALVGVVLMSGFERVLDIRLRLAAFLDGTEAPTLIADWFRGSVKAMVADSDTGRDRFSGRPRVLAALSLAPLNGAAGVPTRVTWEIVYETGAGRTYLRYHNENDEPMTIASWPGNYGGFRYCGADLKCSDTWPVDRKSTQLPALIRLDAIKGDAKWPILAAPESDLGVPLAISDQ